MEDRIPLWTRGRFSVVEARPEDVPIIAAELRAGDLAEILASGYPDAETAIRISLELSPIIRLVGLEEEKPIGAFGVAAATLLSSAGRPWMLGAMALDRPSAQRALLAFSRLAVDLMRRHYGYLENYVDARYEAAIRWIRWMGFTIEDPIPIGIHGEMFHRFWWRR